MYRYGKSRAIIAPFDYSRTAIDLTQIDLKYSKHGFYFILLHDPLINWETLFLDKLEEVEILGTVITAFKLIYLILEEGLDIFGSWILTLQNFEFFVFCVSFCLILKYFRIY